MHNLDMSRCLHVDLHCQIAAVSVGSHLYFQLLALLLNKHMSIFMEIHEGSKSNVYFSNGV